MTKKKKLVLHRETLRHLSAGTLRLAIGGLDSAYCGSANPTVDPCKGPSCNTLCLDCEVMD